MKTKSILDYLADHALQIPNKTAFHYHDAPKGSIERLTFAELDLVVLRVAAALTSVADRGVRVAILLPNSVEYIVALLAAQAAGMIPVPLMAPPSNQSGIQVQRLKAVISDCSPSLCIVQTTDPSLALLGVPVTSFDTLLASDSVLPREEMDPSGIAFLQYTSGSTSAPKGVVVEHSNLIANSDQLSAGLGTNKETIFGSWLPLFHDMGLIGKVIHPLLMGASSHLIKPETFLRRPRKWLEMVSDQRVNICAAPNFAYERCAEHIANVDGLDLSSWVLALNGSEPVSARTLDAFADKFAPAGFTRESFQPVYGMAEATLFVTSRGVGAPIIEIDIDLSALEKGVVRSTNATDSAPHLSKPTKRFVSVGRTWNSGRLEIWNESESRVAREGEVGEILLAGENCCKSYYGKPDLSRHTFEKKLSGHDQVNFMRTGDLGFVHAGELFITGRSKELIVVRGRNIYPQDIESIAQESHPDFVRGGGAAVEVEVTGRPSIILIQEVQPKVSETDIPAMLAAATAAASLQLQIKIDQVVPIRRGTLPKTTSGKIARSKARQMLLAGDLGTVDLHAELSASDRQACSELIDWWRKASTRWDMRTMDERRCIQPHVVLEFGNHGFLGLSVPREYGGTALGTASMMRVIREVASVDLTLAAFLGVHNGLAISPIVRFGSKSQKTRYLEKLSSGRVLGSFALTESTGGSNPRAISARAERRNGEWLLTGRKTWIGTAAWSSIALFFAQAFDEQGVYLGMTAFLLPTDVPGVRQGPESMTMGMRGMVQNELIVDNVRLDDEQVLGAVGQGYEIAQATMTLGRLGVASMALGCMQRATQWTAAYAKERQIATGSLLSSPNVSKRLLQSRAVAEAIRALVEHCCAILDVGKDVAIEVLSLLKAVATEQCWETVDHTMQVFGGKGYDEANRIPQMLRDSRLLRIFEGPTEALLSYAGHAACRKDNPVTQFIAEHYPQALDEARAFDSRVQQILSADDRTGDVERWIHLAVGEAASYALLLAALRSIPSTETSSQWLGFGLAWLDRRCKNILNTLEEDLGTAWALKNFPLQNTLLFDLNMIVGDWAPWRSDKQGEPPADTLAAIAPPTHSDHAALHSPPLLSGTETEVFPWLRRWISAHLKNAQHFGPERSFAEMGLDSIDAVELLADFGDEFGVEVNVGALWEYPNAQLLSTYLVGCLKRHSMKGEQLLRNEATDFVAMLERELAD